MKAGSETAKTEASARKRHRMRGRPNIAAAVLPVLAAACGLFLGRAPEAQGVSRIVSPSDLARPGYEPRTIRMGSTVISPQLDVVETYDSNIFADAEGESDDLVTAISPRVRVEAGPERLQLFSEATATHTEFLENSGESRTTYGALVGSRYLMSRASTLQASLSYDRQAESRGDPETELDAEDAIALYDSYGGSFNYAYLRNRIGLGMNGTVRHTDYDMAADSDRDQTESRFAGRTSFLVSPRLGAFLEGYARRRDYEAATDDTGLDRDATTYGFLAGTTIDLTGKLEGEIGVGLFQTDHDDDSLEDFLGLGVRGQLRWSVSPRTLLAATVTREDEGTVLEGATSQIQTTVGVSLEQEVRHNFLLTSSLGVSEREYDGIQRDLTTLDFGLTGELLLNRVSSVVLSAGYSTRFADQAADEYDRLLLTAGFRFRF